jgi:hypothetical protein
MCMFSVCPAVPVLVFEISFLQICGIALLCLWFMFVVGLPTKWRKSLSKETHKT